MFRLIKRDVSSILKNENGLTTYLADDRLQNNRATPFKDNEHAHVMFQEAEIAAI